MACLEGDTREETTWTFFRSPKTKFFKSEELGSGNDLEIAGCSKVTQGRQTLHGLYLDLPGHIITPGRWS